MVRTVSPSRHIVVYRIVSLAFCTVGTIGWWSSRDSPHPSALPLQDPSQKKIPFAVGKSSSAASARGSNHAARSAAAADAATATGSAPHGPKAAPDWTATTRPGTAAGEEAPQFRPVARNRPANAAGAAPDPLQPVTLEFSAQARFPAILAAPSMTAMAISPSQTAAETRILEDFLSAIGTMASTSEAEAEATGQAAPATDWNQEDQRWEEASRIADEDARIFLGHDGYMQKSLEAALLKRQLNHAAPGIPGTP